MIAYIITLSNLILSLLRHFIAMQWKFAIDYNEIRMVNAYVQAPWNVQNIEWEIMVRVVLSDTALGLQQRS